MLKIETGRAFDNVNPMSIFVLFCGPKEIMLVKQMIQIGIITLMGDGNYGAQPDIEFSWIWA